MGKLVCGVGINDGYYQVKSTVDGRKVTCKIYAAWHVMLTRCYSKKYSFYSSIVCDEWLIFSNFRKWAEQRQVEGRQLSKNLINGPTQLYSPENCVFISIDVINIFNARESARGRLPIGVSQNGKLFSARCYVNGVRKHIGSFPCIDTAHKAWQLFKAEIIEDASCNQDDERVVSAMIRLAKKLRYEHDNDIETTGYF
jgi:hypothetical protein